MNVSELIKELKQFPDSYEVKIPENEEFLTSIKEVNERSCFVEILPKKHRKKK